MADALFSIVSSRKFTKAEREHAMLVGLNYTDYKGDKDDAELYRYQYAEHSAFHFADYFAKKFKTRTK